MGLLCIFVPGEVSLEAAATPWRNFTLMLYLQVKDLEIDGAVFYYEHYLLISANVSNGRINIMITTPNSGEFEI